MPGSCLSRFSCTFRRSAHLSLCPPSQSLHSETNSRRCTAPGTWKACHGTLSPRRMWDFHKDSAQNLPTTAQNFPFSSTGKKSRANNTTPNAHKQQSKTRTDEHTELERLENNEHKNRGPWVFTKLCLFCRWLQEDYKAPAVKGLYHLTTASKTDLLSCHVYSRAQ